MVASGISLRGQGASTLAGYMLRPTLHLGLPQFHVAHAGYNATASVINGL